MKKMFFAVFFIILLTLNCVVVDASESISAQSAIVIDADSGRVLFEKDAYSKRGMASTTKIMTALIVIESADFNEIVTVSPYAAGTEGSSIWLSEGEHISVEDLLYGLLLASGNDAATALAEHVAGNEDAFVAMMNAKAKEIGAINTNFTNPHGLPDEKHYTTAYDLALITAKAMENQIFREIVSTENKTISWEDSQWDRSLSNHNKLLNRYEYATGVKTGYTKKDGRCLVSSAEKDGLSLIVVTLNAPDDWNDHIKLFNSSFEKYIPNFVCKKGIIVGNYIDFQNNAESINFTYNENFVFPITENEKDKIQTQNEFDINYPVKKGQTIGNCIITFCGETIGEVDLIAANDSFIKKNFVHILEKLLKGLMMQ